MALFARGGSCDGRCHLCKHELLGQQWLDEDLAFSSSAQPRAAAVVAAALPPLAVLDRRGRNSLRTAGFAQAVVGLLMCRPEGTAESRTSALGGLSRRCRAAEE